MAILCSLGWKGGGRGGPVGGKKTGGLRGRSGGLLLLLCVGGERVMLTAHFRKVDSVTLLPTRPPSQMLNPRLGKPRELNEQK